MQYYLDGYRSGDPEIPQFSAAAVEHDTLPSEVDVLIVGCGPAGLTLAAQLARFPDIKTAILEQKSGPLQMGQADGIACRTMEMFEAFGFSGRVLKESYWVNETTFWNPSDSNREHICRSGRIRDVEEGLSEFPHVILNQARVHDFFLNIMRNSPTRLQPHYGRKLQNLEISADCAASYPVTVRFERLSQDHAASVETVRARYVVGCDGARSVVRRQIGQVLQGDSANQAWGVMDVLAVTDFPDIRRKAAIHSASGGSIVVIPREGGYLVRLYIQLDKLKENERVTEQNITIERLIAAAQRILCPYTLEVKEVAWWSLYEIGQRLCEKFDDVPLGNISDRTPHVFIAGDACHTHSPKAGQGMNVSMQDSFNLGWKLAAVLAKRAPEQLLHTYSAERQAVAKELIDFDRELSSMFSARPRAVGDLDSEGVDPAEFQRYFTQQGRFTAGTATCYQPSVLIGEATTQHLAAGFPIGMRFHSAPVIRLADAKPMQLGHVARADGRWRLYLFAAAEHPESANSAVAALCRYLADSPQSPIVRFTPSGAEVDSVFDVRAIYQQGHREIEHMKMSGLLLPRKGRFGLRDYEKMFCADLESGDDIFDMRGINRERGGLVIVRPDQMVAHVLPLDAHQKIGDFFAGFMLNGENNQNRVDSGESALKPGCAQ